MTTTTTKKKAGYNRVGQVHHDGVANEHATIEYANALRLYPDPIIHVGGTKSKHDGIAGPKPVGIKLKKGTGNGSHDWGNLGKQARAFDAYFAEWKSKIAEWRTLPLDIRSDETFKSMVEEVFASYCNAALDLITSDELIGILQEGLIDPLLTHDILVTDNVDGKLYTYAFAKHPMIEYIEKGYTAHLKNLSGTAKTSRAVIFTDGVNEYNCGLRFRLTSNNGISAFLGIPKKNGKGNKNGSVTIKMQQDRVTKLLQSVDAEVYDIKHLMTVA